MATRTRPKEIFKWIQGLRALSCLGVMNHHLVGPFLPFLIPQAPPVHPTSWTFAQLPIIRVAYEAGTWLAMFFIISGYLLTAKIHAIVHDVKEDGSSILRRLAAVQLGYCLRLSLPAAASTVISWIMCQLHLYDKAAASSIPWLVDTTPRPNSFWLGLQGLVANLMSTWTQGSDEYNIAHWTLRPQMDGLLNLTMVNIFTAALPRRWRSRFLGLVLMYQWQRSDFFPSLPYTFGAFVFALDDYHEHILHTVQSVTSVALRPVIFLVSLILASYSDFEPERAHWSQALTDNPVSRIIFPKETDLMRAYNFLGAAGLFIVVHDSPFLRQVLSQRFLTTIGDMSFGIYLLHANLMRFILGGALPIDAVHESSTQFVEYMRILFYYVAVLFSSMLWTRWIEVPAGEVAHYLQKALTSLYV